MENIDPVAVGTIVGAGGIAAWFREWRKSRKDNNNFALEFIRTQSERIDKLVGEVADLKAESKAYETAVAILKEENVELRAENARLKTALGEHGRAA